MYTDVYQTSGLRTLAIADIKEKLKQLLIANRLLKPTILEKVTTSADVFILLNEEELGWFYQPILIELPQRKPALVIDGRLYKNNLAIEGNNVNITKADEGLHRLLLNAVLQAKYMEDPNGLVMFSDIPYTVYGSWIAEAIAKRVGVDPQTTLKLMLTFQLYFISLSYKSFNLNDEEKQALALSLSRRANIHLGSHLEIIKAMSPEDVVDIHALCNFIAKQKWNPRLDKLSGKDLYFLLSSGWVEKGNPKETTFAAIEFPPTFISMLIIASTNNYYQKFPIGQVLKRLDRGGNMKNFTTQFVQLTGLKFH